MEYSIITLDTTRDLNSAIHEDTLGIRGTRLGGGHMDLKTKRYWIKTVIIICLFIAGIMTGTIFLSPLWLLVLIGVGLFLLVSWHAKYTAYICPKCGYTFMISTSKDFLSPHMVDKKLLRCPKCDESCWCKAISVKSVKDDTDI